MFYVDRLHINGVIIFEKSRSLHRKGRVGASGSTSGLEETQDRGSRISTSLSHRTPKKRRLIFAGGDFWGTIYFALVSQYRHR